MRSTEKRLGQWLGGVACFAICGMIASTLTACLTCTLIGCDDGLTLELVPNGAGRFAPGTYDIDFDWTSSRLTAPLFGSDHVTCVVAPGDGTGSSCTSGQMFQLQTAWDGKEIWEINVTTGLSIAKVEIVVRVGTALHADATITPSYQTIAPNGERCGPICTVASGTVGVN